MPAVPVAAQEAEISQRAQRALVSLTPHIFNSKLIIESHWHMALVNCVLLCPRHKHVDMNPGVVDKGTEKRGARNEMQNKAKSLANSKAMWGTCRAGQGEK